MHEEMTVRGRIEILELQVQSLKNQNAVLERKARELDRKYERLLERLVKLEPGQPHSCGYKAQPTTTAPPKEITVKIPYDIICE